MWSQAWLGLARGEDGNGGSTGGGGAAHTGRGGAKKGRGEAMVRAEAEVLAVADAMWWAKEKAKAQEGRGAGGSGVGSVVLVIHSNTPSTNLRVHGAARAESPPMEQY